MTSLRVYVQRAASLSPPADSPRIDKLGDETDAKTKRLPRVDRLAIAAARAVMANVPTEGLALMVGTSYGGLQATVDFLEGVAVRGPAFGSPTAFHESVHHAPAGQISILLGIQGLSLTCSARELSGETALKAGFDLVATGRVKGALIVTADEVVPALEAAFRAFGSPLRPREGAAAVLLSTEPGPLELVRVSITSRPTATLRFAAPAAGPELDPCAGLNQVAQAFAERRDARIVTFALGGGESLIELRRAS